jgi:glycosyltransferase involved in cell wall biosynthesis
MVKYSRNSENLGYVGNQIKLIENSNGEYLAILCDDDLYIKETVSSIMSVISQSTYSMLAINYYNFVSDPSIVNKSDFAPNEDKLFQRAYDLMNYPSVGHYSGLVFNNDLAKKELENMKRNFNIEDFQKYRGIIGHIANMITINSSLQSYFIGKRILACRIPAKEQIDYDYLYHLCLDNMEYYKMLFDSNLITKSDFIYRQSIGLANLKIAIVKEVYKKDSKEMVEVFNRAERCFGDNADFTKKLRYILFLSRFKVIRFFLAQGWKFYKILKYILKGNK